ncbi:anti-sigma factor [Salirhabdus salicampi]|uniref:anti-sigma factor n=1 Tax=Salirhabdus salicampi TaxID=476102 RepID=UPI0020C4C2A5|nr:zf-HC2 domain-containing protein [Salirhabdus salicampi]MCP8615502.1 zf-HC2 domain-containing protein [Salirhabdus salicampi]
MREFHIYEEKLIDYLDGTLHQGEVANVEQHLRSCSECQSRCEYWASTLKGSFPSIPESRRKSIWKNLQSALFQKRKAKLTMLYKGTLTVAACSLFFYIGLQFGGSEKALDQQSFTIDDRTEVYDVIHSHNGDSKGYAWYNPNHKEMMLYIHESPQTETANYVFIETKDTTIQSNKVNVANGKTHIYIQDENLAEIYRVIIQGQQTERTSYELKIIPTTIEVTR